MLKAKENRDSVADNGGVQLEDDLIILTNRDRTGFYFVQIVLKKIILLIRSLNRIINFESTMKHLLTGIKTPGMIA